MSYESTSDPLNRLKNELLLLKVRVAEIEACVTDLSSSRTAGLQDAALVPLDLAGLARSASVFTTAGSQVEILQMLVNEAGRFSNQVILFVAGEGEKLLPYMAHGFDGDQWRGIALNDEGPVSRAWRERTVLAFDLAVPGAPGWAKDLGMTGKGSAIPIQFGETCPAVLLADCEAPGQLDPIVALVQIARLILQNQYLFTLLDSGKAGGRSQSRWPGLEGVRPSPPQTAPPAEGGIPTQAVDETAVSALPAQPEKAEVPRETAGAPPEALPLEAAKDTGAAFAQPDLPVEAVQEVRVVTNQSTDATAPQDEVFHHDARRFARLLVAEIKLYNENEVEEGRKKRDLYGRLEADISRSREMYEKRVHNSIKSSVDYLHEEIVRVLAQDDPSALGAGYPGPRLSERA